MESWSSLTPVERSGMIQIELSAMGFDDEVLTSVHQILTDPRDEHVFNNSG
jgi:hypothetical protein